MTLHVEEVQSEYRVYASYEAWRDGEEPVKTLPTTDYPGGLPKWFIMDIVAGDMPPPMPYDSIEHFRMYGEYLHLTDKSDNLFYHTTPVANLESVMRNGLLAGYETPTFFGVFIKREKVPGIYLTDNEDDIYTLYDSLQAYNMFHEHYSIMTVTLPWDWPIMVDPEIGVKGVYLTFRDIGPERLKVCKENATEGIYELQPRSSM